MPLNLPRFVSPRAQFVDPATGRAVSLGQVKFFSPGTTSAKAVYADATGEVALGNVVTLDAAGSCAVFLLGSYRVEVYSANGNLLFTADNLNSIPAESEEGNPGSLIANQNLADLTDVSVARAVLGLVKPSGTGTATTGQVMLVGTLGYGGYGAPTPAGVVDFNNLVQPGVFSFSTLSGWGNAPGNTPGVLEVMGRGSDRVLQKFHTIGSSAGGVTMTRARVASAWTGWTTDYTTGNVLGVVGQASGVPTGALAQVVVGSNSNRYIKRFDGTMRQQRQVTLDLSVSDPQLFGYQVNFAEGLHRVGGITTQEISGTDFTAKLAALAQTQVRVDVDGWRVRVAPVVTVPGLTVLVNLWAEGDWL